MKLRKKPLNLTLITLCTLTMGIATPTLAEEITQRSNQYIDDTTELNQSGWKALISNAYPYKVQASGMWFDAAPIPRPFRQSDDIKSFSDEMRVRLRINSTDGLIVVKDGVIEQQYFRYGFAINDIHQIHSTGKAFTSFAIQPVYDQIGPEGLNKRLDEYLPKLKGKYFGESTLRQALDMKNGMQWTENYEDPNSATMVSFTVSGMEPYDPIRGPESWYERMFDYPKYGEHGKTWVYSSSSVLASSFAAEAIAQKPYQELVQQSYNKLGFEDASWYGGNEFGELSSDGSQATSIRDHAKLGRYMLETKDSAYVDDVWNVVYDAKNKGDAKYLEKYGPIGSTGYKNFWYKMGDDVILALGSSGQFLYVDRSKNLIISKFSSFVEGQGASEFADALSIIKDIAATY
ncbi:amide hydrolase [Vibrio mediterranei AK1]|uniref:serine hydrolase n=1 Tax=Vibrio mediterranei TaxID=689 RepID=UPI00015416B9|nr:serine hydrolase [Vibrio mediterranei]EDL54355.1 amide hydrolase [Vibrio mediterranei AK1]